MTINFGSSMASSKVMLIREFSYSFCKNDPAVSLIHIIREGQNCLFCYNPGETEYYRQIQKGGADHPPMKAAPYILCSLLSCAVFNNSYHVSPMLTRVWRRRHLDTWLPRVTQCCRALAHLTNVLWSSMRQKLGKQDALNGGFVNLLLQATEQREQTLDYARTSY